jgi:hypothetical protein
MTTRFGIRFADRIIPTVEVTVQEVRTSKRTYAFEDVVVKRMRGFTKSHAMSRAFAWSRQHGDPR